MTYEEASRAWAARRLGVDVDRIRSCDFAVATDGYDTSGYYGVVDADVRLIDGSSRSIELGTDLPKILRELFGETL